MAVSRRSSVSRGRVIATTVLVVLGFFILSSSLGMGNWFAAAFGVALMAAGFALHVVSTVNSRVSSWARGTARVVNASMLPSGAATAGRCHMQLVVQAPGLPEVAVRHRESAVPVSRWPISGSTLPVLVALRDPTRLRVLWDDAPSHAGPVSPRTMVAHGGQEFTENSPLDDTAPFDQMAPFDETVPLERTAPFDDMASVEQTAPFDDMAFDRMVLPDEMLPLDAVAPPDEMLPLDTVDSPGRDGTSGTFVDDEPTVPDMLPAIPPVPGPRSAPAPAQGSGPGPARRKPSPRPRRPADDQPSRDTPAGGAEAPAAPASEAGSTPAGGGPGAGTSGTGTPGSAGTSGTPSTGPSGTPSTGTSGTPSSGTTGTGTPGTGTPGTAPAGTPFGAAVTNRDPAGGPPATAPVPDPAEQRFTGPPVGPGPALSGVAGAGSGEVVGRAPRAVTTHEPAPATHPRPPGVAPRAATVPAQRDRTTRWGREDAAAGQPEIGGSRGGTAGAGAASVAAGAPEAGAGGRQVELLLRVPQPVRVERMTPVHQNLPIIPDNQVPGAGPVIDEFAGAYLTAVPAPARRPAARIRPAVTLFVADPRRSAEFYGGLFGLPEISRGPASAVLDCGGGRLVLRKAARMSEIDQQVVHLLLEVVDIGEAYEDLRARGMSFGQRPRVVAREGALDLWATTFRDPDGYAVALAQWRPRPGRQAGPRG